MQMFNCLVGIVDSNGQTHTEVPKSNLPAAELILLRALHGEDKITRIERAKDTSMSEDEVRARLVRTYGKKAVEKEFGPVYRDLPRKFRLPSDDITDEDEGVDNAARASRASRGKTKVDPAEIMA
jgi:hypothetical protein